VVTPSVNKNFFPWLITEPPSMQAILFFLLVVFLLSIAGISELFFAFSSLTSQQVSMSCACPLEGLRSPQVCFSASDFTYSPTPWRTHCPPPPLFPERLRFSLFFIRYFPDPGECLYAVLGIGWLTPWPPSHHPYAISLQRSPPPPPPVEGLHLSGSSSAQMSSFALSPAYKLCP